MTKILVIDDDARDRGLLVAVLEATEMPREVPTMASTLGLGRVRSIDCDNLTRRRTSPKECYA